MRVSRATAGGREPQINVRILGSASECEVQASDDRRSVGRSSPRRLIGGADQESTRFGHSPPFSPSGCSAAEWDVCPKLQGSLADFCEIPSHRLRVGSFRHGPRNQNCRSPDVYSWQLGCPASSQPLMSCRHIHGIESILDGSFGCNMGLLVAHDLSEGSTRYLTTSSKVHQDARVDMSDHSC